VIPQERCGLDLKKGGNKVLKFTYPLAAGQDASGKYVLADMDAEMVIDELDEENNVIDGWIE